MKTALLLASLAASSVAANSQFQACSGSTDQLGVQSIVGKDSGDGIVSFDIKGTAKTDFVGGETKVSMKVLGIPVVLDDVDLCKQQGVSCPIKAGQSYEFSVDHQVDVHIPKGVAMDVKVDTKDSSGKDVSCLDVKFHLEKPATGLVMTTRFGFSDSELSFLFSKWLAHFEPSFPVAIDNLERRFGIFVENLNKVYRHNRSGESYSMALNQFAHLTEMEFKQFMLGFKRPAEAVHIVKHTFEHDGVGVPDSIDWVEKGAVTAVKNQGSCGSCWSFSTTGALEGAYYLKTGKLVSFSEEKLVECDKTDMGCNGGLMDYAFKWITDNGGLCKESDEPYVSGGGRTPMCHKNDCEIVPGSAPKSYHDVAHNEASLRAAVAKQPVAVAIEADQAAFQFYNGGVMTGNCGTQLDHGVLVAGYGEENGTKYWKVKNSWGGSWGESGYIKLERGKSQNGGQCGILLSASYPEL